MSASDYDSLMETLPGGHEGVLVSVGEHCFVIFRGILPEEPGPQGLGSGEIHEITTSFQAEPVHEAE